MSWVSMPSGTRSKYHHANLDMTNSINHLNISNTMRMAAFGLACGKTEPTSGVHFWKIVSPVCVAVCVAECVAVCVVESASWVHPWDCAKWQTLIQDFQRIFKHRLFQTANSAQSAVLNRFKMSFPRKRRPSSIWCSNAWQSGGRLCINCSQDSISALRPLSNVGSFSSRKCTRGGAWGHSLLNFFFQNRSSTCSHGSEGAVCQSHCQHGVKGLLCLSQYVDVCCSVLHYVAVCCSCIASVLRSIILLSTFDSLTAHLIFHF